MIDDILGRIDIVDIVSQYVNLKKTGRNYTGLCPFHNEKTPSFVVSEDKQIFKCFGCGKGGNAITFLREIENLDFYDALKILAEKAGVELKNTKFKKDEKSISEKETILKINKTALNFFHKHIFDNKNALSYLQDQRHINKELIIKYKLGYAPKDSLLLVKYLEEKGFSKEDIIKAGLARKSSSGSLYSFFTNRIIFPIFSSLGDCIAFSGRIFNGEENTGKYINTPETIVYHKSNILYNYNNAKKTKKDFLIVVEGYMDVIGLDRLGYENAVATCGTALTEQHIKLLKRVSNKIIFAFDNDNAGLQASIRGVQIAVNENLFPLIFQIEGGKDFDELANQNQNIDILENSEDAISYFIKLFLKDYHSLGPIQKQEQLNKILEIIKQIPNYSIFWDYLEKIAKKINLDVNILYQQVKLKKTYKNQKQHNNSKEDTTGYTIPSLFYNSFFKQLKLENIENYIDTILSIIDDISDDNLIKTILIGNLNDNEKEKILEKQLWREEKLSTWSEDKIQQNINKEVKNYIINLIMQTIKSPSVDNLRKNELMKILNSLRK